MIVQKLVTRSSSFVKTKTMNRLQSVSKRVNLTNSCSTTLAKRRLKKLQCSNKKLLSNHLLLPLGMLTLATTLSRSTIWVGQGINHWATSSLRNSPKPRKGRSRTMMVLVATSERLKACLARQSHMWRRIHKWTRVERHSRESNQPLKLARFSLLKSSQRLLCLLRANLYNKSQRLLR